MNGYYICLRDMALLELEPPNISVAQYEQRWNDLEQERQYREAELTKDEQRRVFAAYQKWLHALNGCGKPIINQLADPI